MLICLAPVMVLTVRINALPGNTAFCAFLLVALLLAQVLRNPIYN